MPPAHQDSSARSTEEDPQGGRARKELAGKVDHPRETFLNLRGNADGERGGGPQDLFQKLDKERREAERGIAEYHKTLWTPQAEDTPQEARCLLWGISNPFFF